MNAIQRMTSKYPWTLKVISILLLIGYPVFFPIAAVVWGWQGILEWITTPFVCWARETHYWFKTCWEDINE